MIFTKLCYSLFLLFLISHIAHSEITWAPVTLTPISTWDADSMFAGAGLFVKDSEKDIIVSWKSGAIDTGSLYLVVNQDSSRFLFHNLINLFPIEQSVIDLGKFKAGSTLYFKYVIKRNASGDTLYTGQNREGIEAFVSNEIGALGKVFSISGRVNDSTVEVGFEMGGGYIFKNIVFKVTNVLLEGIEKNKLPLLIATPKLLMFQDSLAVQLAVAPDGLQNIIKIGVRSDTIRPAEGANIMIHYTDDCTDPLSNGKLFENAILLRETKSISAFALLVSDTNWLPSDILDITYTRERPTLVQKFSNYQTIKTYGVNGNDVRLSTFELNGRKTNTVTPFHSIRVHLNQKGSKKASPALQRIH